MSNWTAIPNPVLNPARAQELGASLASLGLHVTECDEEGDAIPMREEEEDRLQDEALAKLTAGILTEDDGLLALARAEKAARTRKQPPRTYTTKEFCAEADVIEAFGEDSPWGEEAAEKLAQLCEDEFGANPEDGLHEFTMRKELGAAEYLDFSEAPREEQYEFTPDEGLQLELGERPDLEREALKLAGVMKNRYDADLAILAKIPDPTRWGIEQGMWVEQGVKTLVDARRKEYIAKYNREPSLAAQRWLNAITFTARKERYEAAWKNIRAAVAKMKEKYDAENPGFSFRFRELVRLGYKEGGRRVRNAASTEAK